MTCIMLVVLGCCIFKVCLPGAYIPQRSIGMQAEELNPYLKNGGDGYPDEEGRRKAGHSGIIPTAKVGDGGASWRLKALKRAQVNDS